MTWNVSFPLLFSEIKWRIGIYLFNAYRIYQWIRLACEFSLWKEVNYKFRIHTFHLSISPLVSYIYLKVLSTSYFLKLYWFIIFSYYPFKLCRIYNNVFFISDIDNLRLLYFLKNNTEKFITCIQVPILLIFTFTPIFFFSFQGHTCSIWKFPA